MESLCKFDPIDLPALILEHMYKTVVEHKGKHGMGYGYVLTKVFHHLSIPVGAEGHGTTKVKDLRKQNEVLFAKIAALQEKMIKDNDAANSRLTLVINSLSHQPPSS
ncbi:hypothetical protein KY290_031483 [Solanum tuberosum]|uniref:Uncharacterized protein n=1 Tax=Solanum tuberosum TaxID=4113 RepID=A0ABQ7U9E5_SOLTU|nr:hypothetical protein KY290_031483 [Solanum tuberosum]